MHHLVCKYTFCKENDTHTCIRSRSPPANNGSTLQPEFSTECTGVGWELIFRDLRTGEEKGAGQVTQPVATVFKGDTGGCFCCLHLEEAQVRSRQDQSLPISSGPTPCPWKMSAETRSGWGHPVALGKSWSLSLPKGQVVGGLLFKTQFCSLCCCWESQRWIVRPGPGLQLSGTPQAFQHWDAAGLTGF